MKNNRAQLKAADGGTVWVTLKNGDTNIATPYVEFEGMVDSPSSIQETSRSNFGATFGMLLLDTRKA